MSDKEVFTDIYKNNIWGSPESVSGEGSELARTRDMREQLPILLTNYDIYSILDIGCGDFNWMKTVIGDRLYLGIDIVDDLIKKNNEEYGTEKIKFSCKNILDMSHIDFSGYGCVILRDVLVHLSLDNALYVLNQIRLGSIQYVFITSFFGCKENYDIINTGDWRPLNMTLPPFSLGEPSEVINSDIESYFIGRHECFDKALGMWRFNEITTYKHNAFCNDIVISELKRLAPSTITDVGTGDGYWGKVIKLLLPKVHLTGIELSDKWYSHCNSLGLYDIMIHGNICNEIHDLKGDVIIFGDILEHLEKADALSVISQAITRFKYVIINAPVGFQPQESEDIEEIHRCGLIYEDFCSYTILSYHESGETTNEYKVFTILLIGNEC